MSEFSKQWPTSDNFGEHVRATQEAIEQIESQLFLPEDNRVQLAFGALAMGRKEGAVLAEGNPGTGKSEFGNIVFGEQSVTNVQPTDTVETLLGYRRPTDGEFNPGTMVIDTEDPAIMLDEVAHLGNTGPLHDLWNGQSIHLPNGDVIDTRNMPVYATANFYDGRRNKELDTAFRSRFGLGVLFGDDESIARQIHGRDMGKISERHAHDGILPSLAGRAALAGMLERQFPIQSKEFGLYVEKVLKKLNTVDAIRDILVTDSRTSQGWQVATRAQVLVDGGKSDKEVFLNTEDYSRVAALALGASVSLSPVGRARLSNAMNNGNRATALDAQIAARRIVAGVAYDVTADMKDFDRVDEDKRSEFIDRYAYAQHENSDVMDEFVAESLAPKNGKTEEKQDVQKPRGIFRRRSS